MTSEFTGTAGPEYLIVFLGRSWVLVRARQDHWPSVDLRECLGGDGGAFGADGCANSHEETANGLVSHGHGADVSAYPKVAAEPSMYCPNVRSIPFGPGPKRTMLVKPKPVRHGHSEAIREGVRVPKMKPMIKPTDPPIIPPILTAYHQQRFCESKL